MDTLMGTSATSLGTGSGAEMAAMTPGSGGLGAGLESTGIPNSAAWTDYLTDPEKMKRLSGYLNLANTSSQLVRGAVDSVPGVPPARLTAPQTGAIPMPTAGRAGGQGKTLAELLAALQGGRR